MVMLAMVERGLHLDEPVRVERTVQAERVRCENVDISEPPIVRGVERSDFRALQEHHRAVADRADAPQDRIGDHRGERRDSFLGCKHFRHRLPGSARAARSEWPELVHEDAVDRGAVDQRFDGRPKRIRINHRLSNTSPKRESVWLASFASASGSTRIEERGTRADGRHWKWWPVGAAELV